MQVCQIQFNYLSVYNVSWEAICPFYGGNSTGCKTSHAISKTPVGGNYSKF